MPRKSRIDTPGALHHVIARGIARNDIFEDDKDRDSLLKRLGAILSCAFGKRAQVFFFAWQAGSRVFQTAGQRYLMIFIHLIAAICRTGIDCQLCLGFRQGFWVIPWHPSVRVLDQFG